MREEGDRSERGGREGGTEGGGKRGKEKGKERVCYAITCNGNSVVHWLEFAHF